MSWIVFENWDCFDFLQDSYQNQTHQTFPDAPDVTRFSSTVHRSQQLLFLQVKGTPSICRSLRGDSVKREQRKGGNFLRVWMNFSGEV